MCMQSADLKFFSSGFSEESHIYYMTFKNTFDAVSQIIFNVSKTVPTSEVPRF